MSLPKSYSLPQHIKVNPRSSSKRALEKAIEEDLVKTTEVEKEIKQARKKIKTQGSFDGQYWANYGKVVANEVQKAELLHKISRNRFMLENKNEDDFENSEEARQLRESKAASKMQYKLIEEHSKKLCNTKDDKLLIEKQHLLEILLALPTSRGGVGLGEALGQGRRDPAIQTKFHNQLVEACNTKHEDPKYESLSYCPILGGWVEEEHVTAAHIFPYGAGQTMMDNFFNREHEDKPEMFEIENGMIMSTMAERMISSGHMALVPGLQDGASESEIEEWKESYPRPYKIHVFFPKNKVMKRFLPPQHSLDRTTREEVHTWADLHGHYVKFRSDHRPRARYLYWQWLVNFLKAVMQTDHRVENPMLKELGKNFWGSGGKWMRKKFLLGFAQHVGHVSECDDLLEAEEELGIKEEDVPDSAAAIVGAVQMRGGFVEKVRNEDEDDDDDDDDDDDEDEDVLSV